MALQIESEEVERLVEELAALARESESETIRRMSPGRDFLRIRTPYCYPDGDSIDLFCTLHGDVITVTDLGETNRWLRAQTLASHRTQTQSSLLQDACLAHGVVFEKGMLLARCRPGDSVAPLVLPVARAALEVSGAAGPERTEIQCSQGSGPL